jgi:hypothetical protein
LLDRELGALLGNLQFHRETCFRSLSLWRERVSENAFALRSNVDQLRTKALDSGDDGVLGWRVCDRGVGYETTRGLLKYIFELLLPRSQAQKILPKLDLLAELLRVGLLRDAKELKKASVLLALRLFVRQVAPEPLFTIHVSEEHPPAQLRPRSTRVGVPLRKMHNRDGELFLHPLRERGRRDLRTIHEDLVLRSGLLPATLDCNRFSSVDHEL